MRQNTANFLFCWLVLAGGFSAGWGHVSSLEEIQNLNYQDPQIRQLRAELEENIQQALQQKKVNLVWRVYRVKSKDNFFNIMAKTMQNQDTISSVNRLSSLWDLEKNREWLIPNVRGIAVFGEPGQLAEKYSLPLENIYPVPGEKDLYFLPGKSFSPLERSYFNMAVFIRPVKGEITSRFGVRKDPFTAKSRFHRGIDIGCPENSEVVAAADGQVVFAGEKPGYGKVVIVAHQNNYLTLYGHLNILSVEAGQAVRQGQPIALSGQTGRSTGPHLHFEVRRGDQVHLPRFRHGA